MVDKRDFAVLTQYSEKDGGYIARTLQFPGVSTFGETRVEAIEEMETALELLVETLNEEDEKEFELTNWNETSLEEFISDSIR